MANAPKKDTEFKRFAAKRIIIGVILAVGVLWTLGSIMGILDRPKPIPQATLEGATHEAAAQEEDSAQEHAPMSAKTSAEAAHGRQDVHDGEAEAASGGHGDAAAASGADHEEAAASPHGASTHANSGAESASHAEATEAAGHGGSQEAAKAETGHGTVGEGAGSEGAGSEGAGSESAAKGEHTSAVSETMAPKLPERKERGVATVEAMIAPMEYELKERFYGWRPNDLIDFTDNVNNYQLGVLEVTRRAVVALNERISRTGSTDAFSPSLEDATNWFMIKATKYWFPSAETKYQEGINDLNKYRDALQAKRATFYTRADNLIPLLASFEDLLGSCDENLVKRVEDDGSEVSWFKADNYFFYAKGVAAAMAPILEAIHHDFLITLETRHGTELLHHAIVSCQTAASLEPWLITDSDLDGILANHRANMAAPISHARFYVGALIKALST
jgi:hypothetical protein